MKRREMMTDQPKLDLTPKKIKRTRLTNAEIAQVGMMLGKFYKAKKQEYTDGYSDYSISHEVGVSLVAVGQLRESLYGKPKGSKTNDKEKKKAKLAIKKHALEIVKLCNKYSF